MSAPIDLAVLRVMKRREQWEKIKGFITDSSLDEHTKLVLDSYRRYYEMHPTTTSIDMDVFRSLFFGQWHRTLNEDSVKTYNVLLDRCCDDVTAEQQCNIVNMLIELEMATYIANDLEEYDAGEEIDIVQRLEYRVKLAREKLEIISTAAYATTASLKEKRVSNVKYQWPLPCLRNSCRPVEGGDFIIVAALSDVGKTSLTMMLTVAFSVQTQYPFLWFNNEGPKERVQKRAYGMMLGASSEQIDAWIDDESLDERLFNVYGRADPIRIYDIHGMNNVQLEDLIKRVIDAEGGVGGVIWDMLDNVPYKSGNNLSRKDEILEEKYQWGRQMGVIHDFPNIATSQQSYNKEWQKWPDKGELKDSKVGKQGACDMLLFMTQPVEHTKDTFRYLSAPKNKLALPTAPSLHAEARFEKSRGFVYEEQ